VIKDLSLEQAVLGGALMHGQWIEHARLRPEHFSEAIHGALWAEMLERNRAGRLLDALSFKAWAQANMAEIGGVDYLLRLTERAAVLSAQMADYSDQLRDMALRRRVIEAAKAASARAEGGDAAVLPWLESELMSISLGDDDGDAFQRKGESIAFAVERSELGEARGISSGFHRLDEMIGGLKPALYLIGAASSMGKSTLVAAISRSVAAQGLGVAEFMLEMDPIEDGLRSATALAFQNDHRVRNPHYLQAQRNNLSPSQWDALRGAARAAAHLPLYTDWRPGRSLSQIEASSRRLFRKLEREKVTPGLVVIDHEGLIAPEKGQRFNSLLERANARAEGLLALPKRLGVPVLVAGQLTKEGKRADGEERLPSTDDWKYGGALIEAAHAVMLLHRPAYYAERKPEHLRSPADWDAIKSREAKVIVDKARGGRRGVAEILMDMPTAAVWEQAA